MRYYDRLTGNIVKNLPDKIDFGRFAIVLNDSVRDVSNIDAAESGGFVVRETICDSEFKHIHGLLQTIADSYVTHPVDVTPIIQKFNIELNHFEKELYNHISHLFEIVRNPHSLLNKNTMKVNIGRAKRISNRSYQHLAHHSEDWEKMSIQSPKPSRILHEELIVDYAVYENILLKSFLHRTIKHLRERVKETGDIEEFFLRLFSQGKNDDSNNNEIESKKNERTTVWGEKINRRNKLVGLALKSDKSKEAGTTTYTLSSLESELIRLEHSWLFDDFPKRVADNVVYHDTNVLNSHKHYRFLKLLWNEFAKMNEQDDEKDVLVVHQIIMNNFRIYVESLFVYSLLQMGYEMNLEYGLSVFKHHSLPKIIISSDKYATLYIETDNIKTKIVSLGGIHDNNIPDLPQDTYCFCFYDFKNCEVTVKSDRVYFVSPIDTDSIECSGKLLRKMILDEYSRRVHMKYNFSQNLRDYISVIDSAEIIFDKIDFTYTFYEKLPHEIIENQIITKLKKMAGFKQQNSYRQKELCNSMRDLIADINSKRNEIQNLLVCPNCGERYYIRDFRQLACNCGFVCDLLSENVRFYHQYKDDLYSDISVEAWGMDAI